MPHLADVSYSQNATVSAVREYLQFLTKLYIPPTSVMEPPADGWPAINQENLGHLGKTDEVIDLLRHLPYICDDPEKKSPQAAPGTCLVDWTALAKSRVITEDMRLMTEGDEWESVPPYVVGLSLNAYWSFNFFLDTQRGTIHWGKCPEPIEQQPSIEPILDEARDYAPEEELAWRMDAPAWEIGDFFRLLKSEFEGLSFVTAGPVGVYDEYAEGTTEGAVDAMREVFKAHGWPDMDAYNKEACMKAMREMINERYGDLLEDYE